MTQTKPHAGTHREPWPGQEHLVHCHLDTQQQQCKEDGCRQQAAICRNIALLEHQAFADQGIGLPSERCNLNHSTSMSRSRVILIVAPTTKSLHLQPHAKVWQKLRFPANFGHISGEQGKYLAKNKVDLFDAAWNFWTDWNPW